MSEVLQVLLHRHQEREEGPRNQRSRRESGILLNIDLLNAVTNISDKRRKGGKTELNEGLIVGKYSLSFHRGIYCTVCHSQQPFPDANIRVYNIYPSVTCPMSSSGANITVTQQNFQEYAPGSGDFAQKDLDPALNP